MSGTYSLENMPERVIFEDREWFKNIEPKSGVFNYMCGDMKGDMMSAQDVLDAINAGTATPVALA